MLAFIQSHVPNYRLGLENGRDILPITVRAASFKVSEAWWSFFPSNPGSGELNIVRLPVDEDLEWMPLHRGRIENNAQPIK
jgi:hypothetical protein